MIRRGFFGGRAGMMKPCSKLSTSRNFGLAFSFAQLVARHVPLAFSHDILAAFITAAS
jgi:hypothetical protein